MILDKLLRMKEESTLLGATPQTLRNWSNEGSMQAVVGKGGQPRFKWSEVRGLMNFDMPECYDHTCLIYWRVSTPIQRVNLSRQRDRLEA
jgi:predicted site-specific integrase-resolvase